SEEHTSELQSLTNLVCRLLLEKKKKTKIADNHRDKQESNATPDNNDEHAHDDSTQTRASTTKITWTTACESKQVASTSAVRSFGWHLVSWSVISTLALCRPPGIHTFMFSPTSRCLSSSSLFARFFSGLFLCPDLLFLLFFFF